MRKVLSVGLVVSVLIGGLAVSPAVAADNVGTQTIVNMKSAGVAVLEQIPSSTDLTAPETPRISADRDFHSSRYAGYSLPTTAPTVSGPSSVATTNPGVTGFNGISHADQRLASGGNQFSLEPPDQGLCVGNGFVVETVNDAIAVYNTSGQKLKGVTALNAFFNMPYAINRSTGVRGDFLSDPKCYYDADTNRFFLTVLQIGTDDRSHTEIAVSQTGDPTGAWNLFSIDSTNDGTGGTPSHPSCPCLGDQPLIGADRYGFYISTNEFSLMDSSFNGAQVYAMSKAALANGTMPAVVHIGNLPLAEGPAYSLQPATSPPDDHNDQQGHDDERKHHGIEYFMSALDFVGTLDNRIAVWALTNTSALQPTNAHPTLQLRNVIITSETYGQPPNARQKPGATPLGDRIHAPMSQLNGNDDRMNQVVYANGKLFGAVNTIVKSPDGSSNVGIAYFVVKPKLSGAHLEAAMTKQGYVAVQGQNVMFPSIGVNSDGEGAMGFTLVGPDHHPSAAYTSFDVEDGAGSVHIAAAGAGPEDGFTGYAAFGGDGVSRWGDYSAAVAAPDGSIWMAVEYIPGGPRTLLANWGTYITHFRP